MESKLIAVRTYRNQIEASIAKHALDAENIYSDIRNEYLHGLGMASAPIELMVQEKDLDRANTILKSLDSGT